MAMNVINKASNTIGLSFYLSDVLYCCIISFEMIVEETANQLKQHGLVSQGVTLKMRTAG